MRRLTIDESYLFRDKLVKIWGYDGLEWNPYENKSSQKTIFIRDEHLTVTDYDKIALFIKKLAGRTIFVVSGDNIDYEIALSDFNFFLHESICFDRSFEWVMYASTSPAITFGGELLINFIMDLFDDRQQLINCFNVC